MCEKCILYICIKEAEQCSWCSDYTMGWTVRGSNPGWKDRFIASPERPDFLSDPPRDLFNRHLGYFRGQSDWELKLPTHLYLVTKLRTGGVKPTFLLRVFKTWTWKTLNFVYLCHISQYFMLCALLFFTHAHTTPGNLIRLKECVCLYTLTDFYA